jgi:hypothetical protein
VTSEETNGQGIVPQSLAEIGERLIYLKQRARHCRRVAQSCGDPVMAAALEEQAARYDAQALLLQSMPDQR